MTIQNIDDVMDRIMSLNRNLTEESLKVLLSASGWDREDISEGLRIFRSKNRGTVKASPVTSSSFFDPTLSQAGENETGKEVLQDKSLSALEKDTKLGVNEKSLGTKETNPYTFNLRANGVPPTPNQAVTGDQVKHEDIVSEAAQNLKLKNPKLDDSSHLNLNPNSLKNSLPNNLADSSLEKKAVDLNPNLKPPQPNKAKHLLAKIIFYILLLLVLLTLASYIFIPKVKNLIDEKFFTIESKSTLNQGSKVNTQQVTDLPFSSKNTIEPNPNQVGGGTSKQATAPGAYNLSEGDLANLKAELASLKDELNKYKQQAPEEKTVVKYISQRGPAGSPGKNGRGLENIEATSTGFAITYTDGSQDLIPYSTTTILNILNLKELCFREASSTQNLASSSASSNFTFDVCLNRNSILQVLSKSAN